MMRSGRIILFNLCMVIVLSFSQKALSQADTLASASADTTRSLKNVPRHSLFSAAGYGSNMIYLGSTISQDQPYGFAALSYGFKSSLYITVSAVHLANQDPYIAFYTGSLTFSHTFNSWFDISLGASRYQVAPSLRETLFSNFYYSDLTIGIDWRLLYSKISAGWLYTGESGMYYQFRNSRYFTTPSFFRKKANISFDPYVNLLFGTLSTIDTNTDTITTVTYPFRQPGGGTGNGNGTGSGSSSGSTSSSQIVTNPEISSRFGLMEIDFGVPVSFNAGRFTLEAEPGYILPMFDDTNYPGTKGFVFMLNCYIRIF